MQKLKPFLFANFKHREVTRGKICRNYRLVAQHLLVAKVRVLALIVFGVLLIVSLSF